MKRVGVKRLYHEDGRPYSDAEYEAYEKEQDERKAFWVRAFKDFLVIFVLSVIYKTCHTIYSENAQLLLQHFDFVLFMAILTSVFPAFIILTVFAITVRKMKSRLWFLLISLILPFFMIFLKGLTSSFVFSCYRNIKGEICHFEDGYITWDGVYFYFFWEIYWLVPFVAAAFFLYNPFKNMKK